jgi:hypothetical protein
MIWRNRNQLRSRLQMTESILYPIGAAAVVFAVFAAARIRRQRQASSGTDRDLFAYHSVSVVCDEGACEAARKLGQRRFLANEAPLLPLRPCTVKSCRCRYAHYPDRREDDLRRNPYGTRKSVPPASVAFDRRFVSDRRARRS